MSNILKILIIPSAILFSFSKELIKALALISIITALILVAYVASLYIVAPSKTIDKTVLAGLIIAIFSFVTFLLSKYFEWYFQQITILRTNKERTYKNLSKLFIGYLKSIKSGNKDTDSLVETTFECQEELLIWGSDEVVLKYAQYRDNSKNQDKLICSIENLFLAIRKDLGHKNKKFTPGTLMKIFTDTTFIDQNTKKPNKSINADPKGQV